MSLQDLTNLSIPIHNNQDSKVMISDINPLICYKCQGYKEYITILTEALADTYQENKSLEKKEKELHSDLAIYLEKQKELELRIKDLSNR